MQRTHLTLVLAFSAGTLTAIAPAQTKPAATSSPATQSANADLPVAADLVKKSIEAMGGKAALQKIESAHLDATMTSPMGDAGMETFWMKPDKCLIKVSMPGGMMTMSQGFDGEIAWGTSPMTGGYQIMPAEQGAAMAEQAKLHATFANMDEDFANAKTTGESVFDGRACYKVDFTDARREGDPDRTVHFDMETNLVTGVEFELEGPFGAQKITQTVRNWQETDGVKLFREIIFEGAQQPRTVMTINTVEFNNVEPAQVEAPEEVKKMAAGEDGGSTSRPTSLPSATP